MSQPTEETRERLISKMTESGGRLRVRGALNPILWLSGVVGGPCIIAISWGDPPPIVSYTLGATVGAAILGFLWLLFFDRDRLHSEEYLIRSRTLDLIEDKGSKTAISAAAVHVISKTEFLQLPDSGGSEDKA